MDKFDRELIEENNGLLQVQLELLAENNQILKENNAILSLLLEIESERIVQKRDVQVRGSNRATTGRDLFDLFQKRVDSLVGLQNKE